MKTCPECGEVKWISVQDRLPETKMGWSKNDVLCLCDYSYEIGRTKNGKWVDMQNKPINVTHWIDLPEPPKPSNNTIQGHTKRGKE